MVQSGDDDEERFGENYFQRKNHMKKIILLGERFVEFLSEVERK